jgi:2'-5' RNA ligase
MNSTDTLRLFLAIQIPETVRAELQRLQSELKPLLPANAVRWAKPEQFHLTLKFLGDVPAGELDALSEAARAVCAVAPPLPLRAEGVGFFPNDFSPRVFWVEIKSRDKLLHNFQQQLEAAVQQFAEKQEAKNFAAHVTLARFEKLRRGSVEKFMARAKTDWLFGEWTAREVELVQSKLLPSGAVHAPVAVFRTKNE